MKFEGGVGRKQKGVQKQETENIKGLEPWFIIAPVWAGVQRVGMKLAWVGVDEEGQKTCRRTGSCQWPTITRPNLGVGV
jgi:hypothetical protein